MSQDEVQRAMQLLMNFVANIRVCPYCGYNLYNSLYSKWDNRHTPIVRVHPDRIEAGFFCGKSGKEVILLTLNRGSGGMTEVD